MCVWLAFEVLQGEIFLMGRCDPSIWHNLYRHLSSEYHNMWVSDLFLYRGLLPCSGNERWAPLWSGGIREIDVNVISQWSLCYLMFSVQAVLISIQRNFDRIRPYLIFNIKPADGLAPIGARPSAGTVIAKFLSWILIWHWPLKYLRISSEGCNLSLWHGFIET